MKIKGAIFDMDGTLTDSMYAWKTIGSEYLRSHGKEPKDDVDRRFCSMSVFEAVKFLKAEYGIEGDDEEIIESIDKTIESKYLYEVPLKEGVPEFLEFLHSQGVVMSIATATDKYMADAAITRLGIRHYFKDILTSHIVGVGKDHPDIFYRSASLLGTEVSETAVFEDSVVAVRTAKKAGFIVAGLYDDSFAYATDEVIKLSDVFAENILDLKSFFE